MDMEINRKTESYICVTLEPLHVMPCQDSPHGSPPFEFHLASLDGELRLLNMTLRVEAAHQPCHRYSDYIIFTFG